MISQQCVLFAIKSRALSVIARTCAPRPHRTGLSIAGRRDNVSPVSLNTKSRPAEAEAASGRAGGGQNRMTHEGKEAQGAVAAAKSKNYNAAPTGDDEPTATDTSSNHRDHQPPLLVLGCANMLLLIYCMSHPHSS